MLDMQQCCLVIVDVQGKLAELMFDKENLLANIQILIKAADILDIPIIWCQQVPKALGPTVPQIAELLIRQQPINKASFSCCGSEDFNIKLESTSRKQIILTGIETHVCIYQTAVDLQGKDYMTTVVADAVSSRTKENKQIAINRLAAEGVKISSTEMVLFELLKTARHPQFKQIAQLVK